MELPKSQKLEISRFSQIYNNTVTTYKFYWFVSLLDIFVKTGRRQISFWEIIAGMITEAWYPIHYFRLSFGKSDSLYEQTIKLQKQLNIPIDANKTEIYSQITNNIENLEVKKLLRVFSFNVPYRFLSPWINFTSNKEVITLSQSYTNNCLYAINGESIEVNSNWKQYLNDHYLILRDFTFWNLTIFLQKRNPNVPDVPSKLIKPIQRESLIKQRNFWDSFIEINGSIECIYTGKSLYQKEYDLDHFIPWSFVSHDLLWNLLPADPSINSSKSNNLPLLDKYLVPFARAHQKAIQTIYSKKPNNKLLEDYLMLHDSLSDLVMFSENDFLNVFRRTFNPMVQIAENMGFKYWQNP